MYGQYRSIFNHCDVFGQQRNGNRRKTQNKGYYAVQDNPRSSKVIEVSTNRKPVCNFLLVINSNYHPILYRFGDMAAYCSNFGHCVFEPPFGGLGTTYDVHLGSGVTRIGVTRGGNWRCHPYFIMKKTDDLFSHRCLQSDDLFICPTSLVHCSF